jgi:hypothetical protein
MSDEASAPEASSLQNVPDDALLQRYQQLLSGQ